MEDKKEEDGLSLGELFRVIFNRKWFVLLGTIGITIIGVLIIVLFFNKSKQIYVSEFTLNYPGIEEGRYPNGTTFNYRDIVSLDNLNVVKKSKDTFGKINVEEMYEKNDITISQTISTDGVAIVGEYSISVKQKYFSDSTVAKDFIIELVNVPISYAITSIQNMNYKTNLTNFNNAVAYDTQIDYLVAQRDLLILGYESIISRYSPSFAFEDKTLGEYLADINAYFSNNKINTLYTELETNGYVKNIDSYIETIELEIRALEIEQEDNNKMLAALKKELADLVAIFGNSNTQTYETFNERIVDLTIRNIEIERELIVLNRYKDDTGVSNKGTADFEEKLNQYYVDLSKFTDDYVDAISKIYVANSKVIFHNNSITLRDGGMNIAVGCALSMILGLLLSSCVVLAVDLPKYLKNRNLE